MKPTAPHLHPDLQEIVRTVPNITFTARNLWFIRLLIGLQRPWRMPKDITVENRQLNLPNEQVKIRVRLYRPKGNTAKLPALLWLHGGGYIVGKPEMSDAYCFELVRTLGIAIVSVDYRYAPENPFPTSLEDSYFALKWLVSVSDTWGIDATRIAIGGESAGAGLAAALAQFAYDRREVTPVCQLLIYPMLDNQSASDPQFSAQNFLVWNQASNRLGWQSYLGTHDKASQQPPYAVPAQRVDLTGLPPAWIGVGTLDLFHNEDVAYAQRLKECGVDCQLEIVQGAFHGFDVLASQTMVVRHFRQSQMAFLKKYLFA